MMLLRNSARVYFLSSTLSFLNSCSYILVFFQATVESAEKGEVDVAMITDIDPYQSYHDHLPEAPDEESDEEGRGGGGVGCQQS